MTGSLSIDIFNSGYKPIPGGPGWDDSTPATWPATTSTLICGGRDALLVDALLTRSEGERLAQWVQKAGKRQSQQQSCTHEIGCDHRGAVTPTIRDNAAEETAEQKRAGLQRGNVSRIPADEVRRDPDDCDHVEFRTCGRQHLTGPQERDRTLAERP